MALLSFSQGPPRTLRRSCISTGTAVHKEDNIAKKRIHHTKTEGIDSCLISLSYDLRRVLNKNQKKYGNDVYINIVEVYFLHWPRVIPNIALN